MGKLKAASIDASPDALLEDHIAEAAARADPIPAESDEGHQLYRALVQHVCKNHQRPVVASDIRDLWERIDSLKRGTPTNYALAGIHFKVAEFANSLCSGDVELNDDNGRRLAAWLDDWPNVCLLGHTGRGKSSTINRLFGVKVAEISHHEACTRGVSEYRLVTGTFLNRPTGIVLWDVPGFGDEERPFDEYVKLYKRLARKCDVVVFMLDNERAAQLDGKMFRKLKRRVKGLFLKLVLCVNKADLFYPNDWDTVYKVPSPRMMESIHRRMDLLSAKLELREQTRVVAISALKNWNIYGLVSSMVDAAGESKGANLLRAVKHKEAASSEEKDAIKRFGAESLK